MKKAKRPHSTPKKQAVSKKTASAPKETVVPPVKTALSASVLKAYRIMLLARKALVTGDLSQMNDEALAKSHSEASGDLSNVPLHAADLGTDTYDQDFTIGIMENEGEELKEIEEALTRINEKTYGVCEECTQPIAENRLRAVPYARFCIKCQSKNESRR
jgi:RNA polymerase-binding protein DksA